MRPLSPIGHYGFTGPGFVGPTPTPTPFEFASPSLASSTTIAIPGGHAFTQIESGYHPLDAVVGVPPSSDYLTVTTIATLDDPVGVVTMTAVACGCAVVVGVSRYRARRFRFG